MAWGILQYFLYCKLGVKVTADAAFRFLPYARDIATDFHFGMGQDIRYAGYTSILAVFLKANAPLFYLVAFQAVLSLVALVLIQRIVETLTNSHLCAFVAALLVATCQDIQQWNYYVLTESVFTSAMVFCFAVLILCKNRILQLLSLPLWLFTSMIRPNGFIMIAAALLYFFQLYYPKMPASTRRKMWYAAGASFVLLLALINQLLGLSPSLKRMRAEK
ncbi:hypothetical protein [Rufibacter sediminis]|uniref:hypothetical protein n=1 Tax=Rufibacter sediminis TaxID=2762756 RepID=UPI0019D5C7A8|nr:hypothetical protein [Rufibacter sediminis]